ncbi:hypothetical protein AMJ71_04180 [candidate division TA06 bacterium SM1_40]|uniref:TonB-dependent receptor n=3 Tax=Bacteria division TA06 TaxID=1156500 RepID=A0A0S8JMU8_UNCT6|nr:MAG: hypothetical protein AMJ71_04180 [candidate division TA06 bacterium SM1_40]
MRTRDERLGAMTRRRLGGAAVCGALISVLLACSLSADEVPGETEQSMALIGKGRELLAFREVEVVTLPAMRAQSPEEAQSSVTVLSGEDVKRWGTLGLADAFRGIAGIDVLRVTPNQWEVTARGFNQLLSKRMLVMVDGRTVYADFHGLTPWDALPVVLEDIERIEIIRGPGSALYGANAFNGVINIVTRPVESSVGTRLATRIGDRHFFENSVIHADTIGSWGYKFTGGWRQREVCEGAAPYAMKKVTVLAQRGFGQNAMLTISAGAVDGQFQYLIDHLNYNEIDGWTGYGEVDLDVGELSLQMFTNVISFSQTDSIFDGSSDGRIMTYDGEAQYSRILGPGQRLVVGGSMRRNDIRCDLLGGDRVQYLTAGYVQHEWRPTQHVEILLGGRADYHELTGEHLTPRASMVVNPWKGHYIRASGGSAFLNPTFLESYISYVTSSVPGFDLSVRGDEGLSPETVISYELGYRFARPEFTLRAEAFHCELSDLIMRKVVETIPSPPAPIPGVPMSIEYRNETDGKVYGGEFSLSVAPSKGLRVLSSYSYQRVEDPDTESGLSLSPRHKASLGVDLGLPFRSTATLWSHFVSSTEWETGRVDDRLLVNGYLAHDLWKDRMVIEVAVVNLLGEEMREYPDAYLLERQVSVGILLSHLR